MKFEMAKINSILCIRLPKTGGKFWTFSTVSLKESFNQNCSFKLECNQVYNLDKPK